MLQRLRSKLLTDTTMHSRRLSFSAITAFLLTLCLCFMLIFTMISNRTQVEELTMEQLIMEKSIKINEVLSKLLYKTQMLSSIVMQSSGDSYNFKQIASSIVDDPSILNILIAPGGIVTDVYPLEGNEAVLGLDYFSEGEGNIEAIKARDTGQLVLGGPFNAVQGGQILVGRLPVYVNKPDGTNEFWGIVSVTLKYPDALNGAGLNELKIQGFVFELWRTNPDTNEKQIIAGNGHGSTKLNQNYVEKRLSIANADWYFRILPVRNWYEFPETWISMLVGLCISLLVATIVQNNLNLKDLKNKFELISNTDPLTGIHNRRFFMDTAVRQMDRAIRQSSESYIIIFDLDHFKCINDKYKHMSGDIVLKELSMRVQRTLRQYDLFARYGGEEFIIFASDIDEAAMVMLAERIRCAIAETPIKLKSAEVYVTASLGIAQATPLNSLENAIAFADEALYKAKDEGRNKCVLYPKKQLEQL